MRSRKRARRAEWPASRSGGPAGKTQTDRSSPTAASIRAASPNVSSSSRPCSKRLTADCDRLASEPTSTWRRPAASRAPRSSPPRLTSVRLARCIATSPRATRPGIRASCPGALSRGSPGAGRATIAGSAQVSRHARRGMWRVGAKSEKDRRSSTLWLSHARRAWEWAQHVRGDPRDGSRTSRLAVPATRRIPTARLVVAPVGPCRTPQLAVAANA
jgi:hypothetical protein